MDKLLDKEIHQLYKAPSLSTYLGRTANPSSSNVVLSATNAPPAASTASAKQQPAKPVEVMCNNIYIQFQEWILYYHHVTLTFIGKSNGSNVNYSVVYTGSSEYIQLSNNQQNMWR